MALLALLSGLWVPARQGLPQLGLRVTSSTDMAKVGAAGERGTEDHRCWWHALLLGVSLMVLTLTATGVAPTLAGSEPDLRRELELLKAQLEQDRQRIEQLERQLESMEAKSEQKSKEVEEKVAERVLNYSTFGQYIDRFSGEHRFSLTGSGFATFQWQDRQNTNTFVSALNPVLLYRLTDRALFEGELQFILEENETEINVEYFQFDYLLNDYTTLVVGKFLLPFGEFIERLHPAWINKLVTRPLSLREEGGILNFNNVGVQLRGAMPLGYGDGTLAEYTLYVVNGPRFASNEAGAIFVSNDIDQNRGKGYGARIGVEPLPFDYRLGRFRLGASTYDGIWDKKGDLWFTSWGLDSVYQNGPFELRGEYLRTNRELPGARPDDKREAWYLQAAYRLTAVPVRYLNRTELIVRWLGQNQNAVTEAQLKGGFIRKPRQVAFGLAYWLRPSLVWKLEYDRDLPSGAGDSNAILTQFAFGF